MTNYQPILAFDVVRLGPFEEICGELKNLYRADGMLYVQLSGGTLEFPVTSTEAAICEQELVDKGGEHVQILRIPDRTEPIIIDVNEG